MDHYDHLDTSYKNRGRSFHALATFRRMLAASVAPNRVTMVAALGACAAHCAVDTGIWIHEYVQKQGWEMDVVLGTALVDMYGKCGQASDGMRVFSEMTKRNVYTWNSIIGALALAQDGNTALQWFSRMQTDGIQPDAVTLICVLCACAHAGFVDIGRKIFNLIIQGKYGFQPGIKHFGCMVDLLSSSGHLDDAFRVVEIMPSHPNAVIWSLLLRGCMDHDDSWLSEHVTMRLVELEQENVSYYVLLSNLYAKTGRWQEAQEILEWMNKKGLRKDAGWRLRMLEDRLMRALGTNTSQDMRFVLGMQFWDQQENSYLIVTQYLKYFQYRNIEHGSSNTKIGRSCRCEQKAMGTKGIPASPGDLLAVEICNLGPLPGDEWGYTAIFERENGGGFLEEVWYFEGIYAYSPKIPSRIFLIMSHSNSAVLLQRPLANLPTPVNCLLGKIQEGTAEWHKTANEAARTIPGRENGGNCDINNLRRGSKVYLPVFIDGANLSTGDMHFSQGDGEVSFCGVWSNRNEWIS
ncbi:hypothetical protein ABZP36_016317 [Zizania latifolia]